MRSLPCNELQHGSIPLWARTLRAPRAVVWLKPIREARGRHHFTDQKVTKEPGTRDGTHWRRRFQADPGVRTQAARMGEEITGDVDLRSRGCSTGID